MDLENNNSPPWGVPTTEYLKINEIIENIQTVFDIQPKSEHDTKAMQSNETHNWVLGYQLFRIISCPMANLYDEVVIFYQNLLRKGKGKGG